VNITDAPTLLTATQLTDELGRYTYKDGWVLEIFNDPYEGPFLYITVTVPDGYRPGEMTTLYIRSNVPPIPTAEYFGLWLWWRLDQIERHETREFLRYDGDPWSDPHDPLEPPK
jgi:hypothetical protein